MLPADDHVHTEWSWDAVAGSMERSCARAVELGLPSVSFTEHMDLTRGVILPEAHERLRRQQVTAGLAAILIENVGPDGRFTPPAMDVDGYLACVQRCRERFPDLRIRSGVEMGEPHWFEEHSKALLSSGAIERVLGSLHFLEFQDGPWIIDELFQDYAPARDGPEGIVRDYLGEVLRMVESAAPFEVLAHIDYPIRGWPGGGGTCRAGDFEDEYRAVLRALTRSDRVLEVNTRVPLSAEVVRWWYEEGGSAVSFGSDAHEPMLVARGFADAAAMVEAQGFCPAPDPGDFWRRRV